MDKNILHSILENISIGQEISMTFAEPFAEMTGDYIVLQSKTGRGRGGSRVIEIKSVANPSNIYSSLTVDGKEKSLGTGTSDYIVSMVVNGIVHSTPEQTSQPMRKPRETQATPSVQKKDRTTQVGEKVAKALGMCLQENPQTIFKLTGMQPNSNITGEWRVESFVYENNILQMECIDTTNPERTLSFNSTIDSTNLKDAEVVIN